MRVLVFSDSHLSARFEKRKFELLKRIITEADRVIINGDFWEGHLTTFQKFIDSPWKQLFPLLKEKKAVYLYGNHDRESYSDKGVELFSVQHGRRYTMKIGAIEFVFEHGDRICPMVEEDSVLNKFILVIQHTFNISELIVFRYLNRIFTKYAYGRYNTQIKTALKKELKPHQFFICGHTHYAEYDPERRFANSGFVRHGLAQYILIEDGIIVPKEEWYA